MERTLLGRTLTIAILAVLAVSAANGSPKHLAEPHRATVSAISSHRGSRSGSHAIRSRAIESHRHASGKRLIDARGTGRRTVGKGQIGKRESRNSERRAEARRIALRRPARSSSAAQSIAHARLHQPAPRRPQERPTPAPHAAPAPTAAPEEALYRNGRLLMPPPLRGSLASLVRQNERNDAEGLERILDDDDLLNRVAHGFLVPIPVSTALTVNPKLPENRRYCRPWTAQFLTDLSRAHSAVFHSPLQINSAVRTVTFQEHLERINGNAAPAEGDIASPHLTGAAVDIAKQGLTGPEIAWMRIHLLLLQQAGKLDVEEEFEQACFHITVYKTYAPPSLQLTPSEQTTASLAPAGSAGM